MPDNHWLQDRDWTVIIHSIHHDQPHHLKVAGPVQLCRYGDVHGYTENHPEYGEDLLVLDADVLEVARVPGWTAAYALPGIVLPETAQETHA